MSISCCRSNRWLLALALLALALPAGAAGGMATVPGGPFLMGEERHQVQVQPFRIDRLEVTNARYRQFLTYVEAHGDGAVRHPDQPAGKSHVPRYWKSYVPPLLARDPALRQMVSYDRDTFAKPTHPVVGVDWYDAWAWCRWAGGRLPTEAEWEKAARGTDGRTWPWGDRWDYRRANAGGYELEGERDGHVYSAPAGSFPDGRSPYGCLDMAGNVWEWTATSTRAGSEAAPGVGPPRTLRILKGGSSRSYPSSLRPARRTMHEPEYRTFDVGFRCARD